MNQTFSRRDFFAWLANPLRQATQRIAANEQRTHNLRALHQGDGNRQCTRCYLPFQSQEDTELCPTCRDAEAKNRDLMQALFKQL